MTAIPSSRSSKVVAPGRGQPLRAASASSFDESRPAAGVQMRAEPHLGASDDFADSDKLRRQYVFYDQFNAPPPRRRYPFLSMAAILAIAIGALLLGLGMTLWQKMSEPGVLPFVAAHAPPVASVAGIDAKGNPNVRRGIDPHELPYDGVPQSASGSVATADVQVPRDDAGKLRDKLPAVARDGTADSGRHVAPRPETSPKASMKAVVKAHAAPHNVHEAKAAPVRHARKRSAKDLEIERLKRQADEELKKKIEDRRARMIREKRLLADVSRMVRARFAGCSKEGSFFSREKCKWEVCGGMWGKNGCPSYDVSASLH